MFILTSLKERIVVGFGSMEKCCHAIKCSPMKGTQKQVDKTRESSAIIGVDRFTRIFLQTNSTPTCLIRFFEATSCWLS